MNTDSNKLHSLNLFRGVCGYGVAICHFYSYLYNDLYFEYFSMLFVEWFFVLSGFVLYPQLIKVLDNNKHLSIFYYRRWMRTLPLYLFALCCASIVTNNLFAPDFFKYLFFIQKMFPGFIIDDYFPVVWSLSIEEYFYLCFPLFLIFINSNNFIQKILLLLAVIIWLKLVFSGVTDINFYRTGTLVRLDAILVGFIGAHYKEKILQHRSFVLLLLVILFAIFFGVRRAVFQGEIDNLEKIVFVFLLQFIAFFTLFAFITGESLIQGAFVKKMFALFANQTYAIYLFHLIFLYIIKIHFMGVSGIFYYYLLFLFLSSWVIYHFFEAPILSCRPGYKS